MTTPEPVEPASESQQDVEQVDESSVHTVQESAAPDTETVEPSTDQAGEFNADPANGYFGVKVDPTPNEHYSVAGVIAGKPTPETDPEHAAKVRAHLANLGH